MNVNACKQDKMASVKKVCLVPLTYADWYFFEDDKEDVVGYENMVGLLESKPWRKAVDSRV